MNRLKKTEAKKTTFSNRLIPYTFGSALTDAPFLCENDGSPFLKINGTQ